MHGPKNINFRNSVEKFQISLISDKNNGYYMSRPMYIYDGISLNSSLIENSFRHVVETLRTRILCSVYLSRKSCLLWDNLEKCCTAGKATWQYAHAFCMLVNLGYKHTLRICNTCCFSTATVVTRTGFRVTVTLSVLLQNVTNHSEFY